MNKSKTINMTEGNIIKQLIFFSIPMLIGNLFQQLYNVVDSVVVGKLVGADALAAIGTTSSITFLFFALCNGIGSGGGIITSQYFGMNNTAFVKKCISNTGYIMVVFPLFVGTVAFFLAKPLLILLQAPENIIADATAYLRVMCLGIVFVSVYNYISSMLRALGDSKTPLYFLIFSCILNTFLDILFVKYFHMGVVGAGVATLISQFTSGILCIIYAFKYNPYFKLTHEDLIVEKQIIASTLKMGIPLSLQFSLIAVSAMAMQRVVNSFGAITVAAFTAVSRIEQIIHMPYQTLSTALSTFTGQNYGAKKTDRMKRGYKNSLIMMVVFTIAMVSFMQLFGKAVTSIFVDDPEVILLGSKGLQITSLFYFFLGIIYIVRGYLTGISDAFFALFNGIVEVIGRFTVPILLTSIPLFGMWGIWWSAGIVWMLSGVTAWFRYLYKKRKMNI